MVRKKNGFPRDEEEKQQKKSYGVRRRDRREGIKWRKICTCVRRVENLLISDVAV